jgi:hypothetical protein
MLAYNSRKPGVVGPNGVLRKFDSAYGTLQESHMQPKLTPEEIHLLRELNERDRQALRGMPRPPAVDRLQALGYDVVHSPNSEDLLFSITAAGRAALATIDAGA